MLPTKAVNRRTSASLDILEYNATYSNREILRRLRNCRVLIGQQARFICDQWMEAKRNKETETTLQEWMVGKQIAVVGQHQMLQIEQLGRFVDVMPSDLAEKVSYDGLGYTFTVVRDGSIVRIDSLTDTLVRH